MSGSEDKTCNVLQDLYTFLQEVDTKPDTGRMAKVPAFIDAFCFSLISCYAADNLRLSADLPPTQYLHCHKYYLHGKI